MDLYMRGSWITEVKRMDLVFLKCRINLITKGNGFKIRHLAKGNLSTQKDKFMRENGKMTNRMVRG